MNGEGHQKGHRNATVLLKSSEVTPTTSMGLALSMPVEAIKGKGKKMGRDPADLTASFEK